MVIVLSSEQGGKEGNIQCLVLLAARNDDRMMPPLFDWSH